MKYLLMMHAPRGTGNYEIFSWSQEDFKAHMDHLNRINRELKDAGEWIDVHALMPPSEAKLVRAGANGEPVTDGPFPEAKEFLAGYWIVDVASPERAYEIAAMASAAPGPGGVPLNMPIEVRRVMGGAPPDEA
ncbi:YciI family protein [Gemmatimonas sp. UBA7669]|uniref:YciI family protein n=1 Tax=Gemmatimonas sp. UBA7669 TaxID=1946568 RepID=UPI0025BCA9E3|nr:YciI family protein [Gemmatimonas sp. UBA7669]